MRLLVIRHAIAEDREVFAQTGQNDSLRPLTKRGRRRMEEGSRGLRLAVKRVSSLGSSGFVRADQTAKIVARAFGNPTIELVTALQPEKEPEAIVPWLGTHEHDEVAALVGHEPQLSRMISALLAGGSESFVSLGKGGAALLEFTSSPALGAATLLWLAKPSHLRRLAR